MDKVILPRSKRIFDIVSSFCLLVIFLPFILFSLILILIEHIIRGMPSAKLFYHETRFSYGQPFQLIKFNIFNPHILKQYHEQGKFVHTKDIEHLPNGLLSIGFLLKQIYLDELPQLYNVLKGDLSIVGPRPANKEVFENLMTNNKLAKSLIKSGITGPYQAQKGVPDKKDYILDQSYVDFCRTHSSFQIMINDLKIILSTIIVIFKAKGY